VTEQEIDTMTDQHDDRTVRKADGLSDPVNLDHVLTAVAAVMDEVQGIAKSGRVTGPGMNYTYRKADDVVEDLGTAFRRHRLFLQSRVVEAEDRQYTTTAMIKPRNGGEPEQKTTTWNRRMVVMEYRITSLIDGSELTVQSTGEGLDNSDKASNKAMTSALKYALTQGFMISTSDMNDPDDDRPMVETEAARAVRERRAQEQAAQQAPAAAPAPASTPVAEPPAEASAAGNGQLSDQGEIPATKALTEAAKQAVQMGERHEVPNFTPEQAARAVAAHQAAIKGNRAMINRVILQVKAEGLMHATVGDSPLHAQLATLREVAR
jgi:hypothetical protein